MVLYTVTIHDTRTSNKISSKQIQEAHNLMRRISFELSLTDSYSCECILEHYIVSHTKTLHIIRICTLQNANYEIHTKIEFGMFIVVILYELHTLHFAVYDALL